MESGQKHLTADSTTSETYSNDTDVELKELDSDEEVPFTFVGPPQPICFPIIKDEHKDFKDTIEQTQNFNDEINDLCSPPSVINLDESDEEEAVESNKEIVSGIQNGSVQYDTIDLTLDDENDIDVGNNENIVNDDSVSCDDPDDDNDDDDDDSDDGDISNDCEDASNNGSNAGDCGKSALSSECTESDLDTKAAAAAACVIRPSFICRTCNKCFISECSLYISHVAEEMNYLCTICMTFHKNENEFCEHLKSHENRYVLCQLCKDKTKLVNIVCSVCGCTFDKEELYENHQKTHTSQKNEEENKLSCLVCKRNFVSKTLLEIHERLHTEELFKCNSCGGQFWTQQILIEHQDVCGASKTSSLFKCSLCEESFKTHSVMAEHMRQCTDSRCLFFYCELCPDLFSCANALVVHRLMHLSSKCKNFLDCDCCEMKFFSASGLAAHKYCTGKIAYSCSPCNLQFLLESSFVLHLSLMHSVKASVTSKSNKKSGNIIIEKIGEDGKKNNKDKISHSDLTCQVESHRSSTQDCQLSDSGVNELLLGNENSSLPSLKNTISDSCLPQVKSSSDQQPFYISKRDSDKIKCFEEISPSKAFCKISTHSTILDQNIRSKNLSPTVSISSLQNHSETTNSLGNDVLSAIVSQIQPGVQKPHSVNLTSSPSKLISHLSYFQPSLGESENVKIISCNRNSNIKSVKLLQTLINTPVSHPSNIFGEQGRVTAKNISADNGEYQCKKRVNPEDWKLREKHLKTLVNEHAGISSYLKSLKLKRIHDQMKCFKGNDPNIKFRKISPPLKQISTCQDFLSGVVVVTENDIHSSRSEPLESRVNTGDKFASAFLKSQFSQSHISSQQSQPVKPTSSDIQQVNSNMWYPKILPKSAVANIQPSCRKVVKTSLSQDDNFKIVPGSITPTVQPSQLHTVNNPSSLPNQSDFNNVYTIVPNNIATTGQFSSEVLNVVTYVTPQTSSPMFITAPTHDITNMQPSSQIMQTLPVGNLQPVQSVCVSSPGKLDSNCFSSIQPNSPTMQSITITAPLANSNSGYIYGVFPPNKSGKNSLGVKTFQLEKYISCEPKKRMYRRRCVPEDNTTVLASPKPKEHANMNYSRMLQLPRRSSKCQLLPLRNSNSLRSVPVATVQAFTLDNTKNVPDVQTKSLSYINLPTMPQTSVPFVVPVGTNATRVVTIPTSPCESNPSQPIFVKVFDKPGSSRLQRGVEETLNEVQELESDPDISCSDQIKRKKEDKM